VRIRDDLEIDEAEIDISAARSSGPGGQHVNKTETKVVLTFDLEASRSLTPEQRNLLREALGSRLTRDGRLRVVSQKSRSRASNEQDARTRFAELVRCGLERPAQRRDTDVPRAERRRRLDSKRKRSSVKRLRRPPGGGGEE
jgi:ribosome-associated protein